MQTNTCDRTLFLDLDTKVTAQSCSLGAISIIRHSWCKEIVTWLNSTILLSVELLHLHHWKAFVWVFLLCVLSIVPWNATSLIVKNVTLEAWLCYTLPWHWDYWLIWSIAALIGINNINFFNKRCWPLKLELFNLENVYCRVISNCTPKYCKHQYVAQKVAKERTAACKNICFWHFSILNF